MRALIDGLEDLSRSMQSQSHGCIGGCCHTMLSLDCLFMEERGAHFLSAGGHLADKSRSWRPTITWAVCSKYFLSRISCTAYSRYRAIDL